MGAPGANVLHHPAPGQPLLLGIRQGSRIEFVLVGDHAELRVKSSPSESPGSGFGMLKSRRAVVPADFDPATLLRR